MTTHCRNCEAEHSDAFARVFGDNDNQIHFCPDCEHTSYGDLGLGAGAGLDTRKRQMSRGGVT